MPVVRNLREKHTHTHTERKRERERGEKTSGPRIIT